MLKIRRAAATKVAESLFAAEEAIDAALARAAELTGNMVVARQEANLSAIVGQDAFELSASAFAALARARSDIVETHKRLSETQVQVGLRTMSWGEQGKPPQGNGEARHLKSVA